MVKLTFFLKKFQFYIQFTCYVRILLIQKIVITTSTRIFYYRIITIQTYKILLVFINFIELLIKSKD